MMHQSGLLLAGSSTLLGPAGTLKLAWWNAWNHTERVCLTCDSGAAADDKHIWGGEVCCTAVVPDSTSSLPYLSLVELVLS